MRKLILIGICSATLLCAQTAAPPYLTIGSFYYIPSAEMQSTIYSDSNGSYDARPGQSILNWTPVQTSILKTEGPNGNWLLTQGLGNDITSYGFFLARYTNGGAPANAVQATFSCGPNDSVSPYGSGCGIALFVGSGTLVTMSHYNIPSVQGSTVPFAGSVIVLSQWCYDPDNFSCVASAGSPPSAGPFWRSTLGVFPAPNGIQIYRIVNQTFLYSLDGGTTWTSLGTFNSFGSPRSAGLFVNTGSIMNVYMLGGIY